MEDRNSLFNNEERALHITEQIPLIAKAKQGHIEPLLLFWADKRKLFLQRAFERSIPA